MKRGVITAVAGCVAVLMTVFVPVSAQAAPARDRYAVGDSVMLGARSDLRASGFGVDATESRQAYKGPSLLRKRGGRLPMNVVVHLGTNGTYPLATCKALVKAAGPDRRVFLVTVHVRLPADDCPRSRNEQIPHNLARGCEGLAVGLTGFEPATP